MTKIINSINIKIHEKKSKNRKYKRRNVRTHQNAPYSNVASLITNRPQQLDISTASNREKENIISNAINTVKREKEILTIKDKEPETVFESPKPPPTKLQPKTPKRITDFFSKTPDNNLYNVYPEKDKTNYADRFEVIDEFVKKGRGRPIVKKDNETGEEFINRIKKGASATAFRAREFTTPKKDIIPPPVSQNKIIESALKNISESRKNTKLGEAYNAKITKAFENNDQDFINKYPILASAHKLETERAARARKREEKSNEAISALFNNNQFL